MCRYLPIVPSLLVLACCAGALPAQEGAKSGPQIGQMIPGPFQPVNATGPYAGRPHCLVCQFGLRPVVLVFARETGEPDGPVL